MRVINRTVLILSFVSFCADIASEMLYPVVPVYLKEIGFSVLLIGILEGIAEFVAGFTKGYFGKRSDEEGLRLPFIKTGYFLSALSKPMMAVFTLPLWIFLARTIDRLGKGIRTAARDALLSENARPETIARVFGFHRGMDTLGALIGPVLALTFLHYFPGQYASLFYLAFIPGLAAVALIFLLKEQRRRSSGISKKGFFSFLNYWRIADKEYKKLVAGLLLFTLFNSSDVFLLLKAREVSGSDTITIGAYIFYNLVYAVFSYPAGVLADQWGMKRVFITGLGLFAFVYFLFAIGHSVGVIFFSFFLYGIYAASTEGIAKAWITQIAGKANVATAVGFYTSCQSIFAFLASAIAGLLWSAFNSSVAFFATSVATLSVVVFFQLNFKNHIKQE